MPRASSARCTSSMLGRPLVEPKVRWTEAAAAAATRTPANAPLGVVAPNSRAARPATTTSQRPRRRAARLRWGDAAMTTAPGTARRNSGKVGGGSALATAFHRSGQEPPTSRAATSAVARATSGGQRDVPGHGPAPADDRGDHQQHGQQCRARRPGAARSPSRTPGKTAMKAMRDCSKPDGGRATTPMSTRPATASASWMTSVARRERRRHIGREQPWASRRP